MQLRQAGSARIAVVAVVAGAALAAAVAAGGAAARDGRVYAPLRASMATETSANWAGYAVTAPSTTYTSVTATWVQPKVTCDLTVTGLSSAFWVGLGGYSDSSQALEQAGTSADCDPVTGRETYYAWYELVPSPSVNVKHLKIAPGDVITASVNALDGGLILLQVKNRTRGTVFTTRQTFATPDLTSAEWIAEAPSNCFGFACRPIPLSNFGSVGFTRIAALGNGVGGTLTANPGWTTTAIRLVPDAARTFFAGPDRAASSSRSAAGATPGDASSDGRSFSVDWTADASAQTAS